MTEVALNATIITMSFRGDFETCRLLCESVDRFVPDSIAHRLFVPTQDMSLFAPLANARRTIQSDADLLPRWFWKLPMPNPRLRALLRLPRRNMYVTPFSPPVRGWIAQQIMKITASARAETEIVLHVDSDGVFVRPLKLDMLLRADGKVRLYQNPQKVDLPGHRLWHETASRLMGLKPDPFHGGDYIGHLVVWRRSVAQKLTERLAEIGNADWRKVLARTPHFSEYILYGVFAEVALGMEASGHWAEPKSLCHALWSEEIPNVEEEDAFVEAIKPEQIACLVQSTLPVSLKERRRLFDRVVAQAARQDAEKRLSPTIDG
jgi:hypothetical protein